MRAKGVKPRTVEQDVLDSLGWTGIESETRGVATVRCSGALNGVEIALGASATTAEATTERGSRSVLPVEEVRASRRSLENAEESR